MMFLLAPWVLATLLTAQVGWAFPTSSGLSNNKCPASNHMLLCIAENCKGTNDKCTAGQYNGCSCIDGDKVPLVYTRALGERGEDTGYLTEYPGTLAELDQQQKVLAEMERLANGDEDEDEDCDEDDE